MSRKYNWIMDDAVMKVSIEKSHYDDKSHYYDGFMMIEAYRNYQISL